MGLTHIYFLGLNLGFWFIGLPLGILIFYTEHIDEHQKRKRKEELIARLPNTELIFNINEEERWMLDSLRSMSKYSSDDKFLRNEIKKVIEKESNNFNEEFNEELNV